MNDTFPQYFGVENLLPNYSYANFLNLLKAFFRNKQKVIDCYLFSR